MLADQFSMTINGRAVSAPVGIQVVNPADETVIASVSDARSEDLEDAVLAARDAFVSWKLLPFAQRALYIVQLAEALESEAEDFARLLTMEQGKPIGESRAEVARAVEWLRATATFALPADQTIEAGGMTMTTSYVPIGVVAAIVPWNFPVTLMIWKVAPALLAGNAIIVKPSPNTPLTALRFGELTRSILPPGIVNVISGSDRLGPMLVNHPGIDKIAFTGSTATGKAIMRDASDRLAHVTLELGGNDAAIVLDDIDIAATVPALFWAAFRNNAQVCVAAKRMFIHESIYAELSAAIVEYTKSVRIGDGMDEATQIGPVQNKAQLTRLHSMLADARSSGVRFLIGGELAQGRGYFLPIAIADNPKDDAPLVTEEAFGPILPLLRFKTVDEVVERANRTRFGLGASVWSRDRQRALDVANQLDVGTVWINTAGRTSPFAPFGGRKESGVGIENGLQGLLSYMQLKSTMLESA